MARLLLSCAPFGKMPEWSNGTDSKSVVSAMAPRVQIPIFPPFIEEPRNSSSYGAFCLGLVMSARPQAPALPADSAEYANPCHFLDFGHAA